MAGGSFGVCGGLVIACHSAARSRRGIPCHLRRGSRVSARDDTSSLRVVLSEAKDLGAAPSPEILRFMESGGLAAALQAHDVNRSSRQILFDGAKPFARKNASRSKSSHSTSVRTVDTPIAAAFERN